MTRAHASIPVKLRFQSLRVIFALVMREMTTTYGRSPGGYLWAIVEPVVGVALLTLAFGFFLRAPPLGTDFALFYATGLLPFMLYVDLSGKIAQAIQFSRPLLVYPRVTFLDAILARFALNLLAQILVVYVVFVFIALYSGLRLTPDFRAIGLALALAALLGCAVGILNSVLFAFFPLWERIWAVINRPALLVSCIFYTFEDLPETLAYWLWFNPLVHIIGMMRVGFYPTYSGSYISVPYVVVGSIMAMMFGVFFLRVHHRKMLNEL